MNNDEAISVKIVIFEGDVVGNIVSWEQSGERVVGYWFGKQHWGKGIATAALSQFLHHVKERPLFAHVVKHNVASIRVLQKCGFTISSKGRFSDAQGVPIEEFVLILT